MFILEELHQITETSVDDYFDSRANRIDIVMTTTMLLSFLTRVSGHYAMHHFIMSVGVIIVSIRLLYMLCGFDRQLAILLSITIKMLRSDVFRFVVVLMSLTVGFELSAYHFSHRAGATHHFFDFLDSFLGAIMPVTARTLLILR